MVRPARWPSRRCGDPGLGVGVDRARRLDQHEDLGVAAGPGPAPAAAAGRRRTCGPARRPAAPARPAAPRARRRRRRSRRAPSRSPAAAGDVEPARSGPENRAAPVSETTTRRRTTAAAARSGIRPPAGRRRRRPTAHSPSRSASAAVSSGCSATSGLKRPGRPEAGATSTRSESAGGGTGCAGSTGRGRGRAPGRRGAAATRPGSTCWRLGGRAQRDHQEGGVAVERDQLAGADRSRTA